MSHIAESLLFNPQFQPQHYISKPLTYRQEMDLRSYQYGVDHLTGNWISASPTLDFAPHTVYSAPPTAGSAPSPNVSPASSSTTLVFEEEDEIKRMFFSKANAPCPLKANPQEYTGATPNLSSIGRTLPEDELNPHAAPFVSQLRPNTPQKPRPLFRPAGGLLPRRISRWMRTFGAATKTPFGDHEVSSRIIVNAEHWTPESIAQLAQEFCWRAAEAAPEELDPIVTFAEILHLQFKKMKNDETAELFLCHLEECVVETFKGAWAANHNPEAISYDSQPSKKYVDSAIQLGKFVGELFTRGLLDSKHASDCLETLVSNFVSVEHADAINVFIMRAGPAYWTHHPEGPSHLRRFIVAFSIVTQKLRREMSVLNVPWSPANFDGVIGAVGSRCRAWAEVIATAMVQTPRPGSNQERRYATRTGDGFMHTSVSVDQAFR